MKTYLSELTLLAAIVTKVLTYKENHLLLWKEKFNLKVHHILSTEILQNERSYYETDLFDE